MDRDTAVVEAYIKDKAFVHFPAEPQLHLQSFSALSLLHFPHKKESIFQTHNL